MSKPTDSVTAITEAWRRERPDLDPAPIEVVTRIGRLSTRLRREREQVLAEQGTDSPTLDLVATLRRSGPPYRLTAGQLQRACLVTAGAISQRLDHAEAAGLIERVRDPDDRRVVYACLTEAGAELADRAYAAIMHREEELLAPFTAADRAELARLLGTWLQWWERRDQSWR